MRTFPSFRVSRSRLATAVVGFGVAATIACGDASPQMEDAATMLDDAATILRDMQTDANAQPVPLEPMVLDCDLSYQLVQTTNPGEVNQFVSTRSGAYDRPEGTPFKEEHQPAQNSVGNQQDWPPRNHGTEQSQWCDNKGNDWNGQRIGQWRNQRKLLKDQQQNRQRSQRRALSGRRVCSDGSHLSVAQGDSP